MRIIFGEGPNSIHESDKIRIDIVPEWADVVCDLNENLPKATKIPKITKVEYIEASHVLEHIESNKQMKRIFQWVHDTLEIGGIFDIKVPYWKSDSAVECIEHVRFFNENSFMNFYANPYAKEMKMPQFELVSSVIEDVGIHKQVHTILKKI